MIIIYSFFYTVFLFIYIPFFILTNRKKGYSVDIKERFVLYTDNSEKNTLWFHCASVGELNVAYPIVERLKDRYEILITVSSPRGKSFALEKYPFAKVRSLPFDIPFLMKRFLNIYRPLSLIIVEGEFWPNLIFETSKKIPVMSVNTRISPSSFVFYKRYKKFFSSVLNSISRFFVRSEKDLYHLGFFVQKDKIKLCGDLKFVSSSNKKDVYLDKKGKKVIVAGSTHDPEEKVLINIYKNLRLKYPDLRLIIAPRHIERIDQIKGILKEEGLTYSFRTETEELDKDVYIVDTVGELSGIYKYADVVFVGGTIAPIGGHNILEPVSEGKPVVIGNHYEKIEDLYNFLKNFRIVFSVDNGREMEKIIDKLLDENFKPDFDISAFQRRILNCYINGIKEFLD